MHKTLFGEGCLKWYLTVFSVFYEFLWGLKISSENVIMCRALFWAQESIYVYLNGSHGHWLYLWHAWQWQTSFLQHDSNVTGKIKQFQWTKISPFTKFSLIRNREILKTGKIVYWLNVFFEAKVWLVEGVGVEKSTILLPSYLANSHATNINHHLSSQNPQSI